MENIDAKRINTICWRFLAPNRWTDNEDRFLGAVYLSNKADFRRAGAIDVVFKKDEYIGGYLELLDYLNPPLPLKD